MERMRRFAGCAIAPCAFLALFLVLQVARPGVAGAAEIDWSDVGRRAGTLLSEYIRIDTTNPPGNEIRAADFLAERFRDAGFPARVVESESGRASVAARLRGAGTARPIILLNHLDVVPADAAEWTHPPFAGVIEDGWVYGRGAIDCKGMGVVEAMAMLVLKESGAKLSRDVIFLGTADEEVGGKLGAGWFAQTHLASLGEPEFLLNEGGGIRQAAEGKRTYEVAVAEKTPL